MTDFLAVLTRGNYKTFLTIGIDPEINIGEVINFYDLGKISSRSFSGVTDKFAMLSFTTTSSPYYSYIDIVKVYDEDITEEEEIIFNLDRTNYLKLITISIDKAIIFYQDTNSTKDGKIRPIDINWESFSGKIGQAQESGLAGEEKDVLIFKDYTT